MAIQRAKNEVNDLHHPTDAEGTVLANIERKEKQAYGYVCEEHRTSRRQQDLALRQHGGMTYRGLATGPDYQMYLGDSVKACGVLPTTQWAWRCFSYTVAACTSILGAYDAGSVRVSTR